MMAHMDGGSELDGVGQNWVSYLELHGGTVVPLEAPQEVTWSDEAVVRKTTETVKMHVKVAGSAIDEDLTFFVLPWETNHLIVGWESMNRTGIQRQLEDLLTIQETQGLGTGVGTTDGEQFLTDMDGASVSTDELLFVDEPQAEIQQDSGLNPEEKQEMDELSESYPLPVISDVLSDVVLWYSIPTHILQ